MLVSVPIFLSDSVVDTKVEIQIRTIAMDFWASLEHKIYYKFEGNAPDYISRDLRECAKMVSELDEKMLSLNEAIQECILQQENKANMDDVVENVIGNRKEQSGKEPDTVKRCIGFFNDQGGVGSLKMVTLTLNEDGTVTAAVYIPKERN